MKSFPRKNYITGLMTLLCILLLSTTAFAAEATGNEKTIQTGKETKAASTDTKTLPEEIGPGIKKKAVEPEPVVEPEHSAEPAKPAYKQGESLGLFTATAYCPNKKSSGRTYSGTIPQPQHTISADTTILPLGTKVMIDGIIYTVEDVGSGVKGNKVDIFFSSRAEALNFGRQTKELFAVIEQ